MVGQDGFLGKAPTYNSSDITYNLKTIYYDDNGVIVKSNQKASYIGGEVDAGSNILTAEIKNFSTVLGDIKTLLYQRTLTLLRQEFIYKILPRQERNKFISREVIEKILTFYT